MTKKTVKKPVAKKSAPPKAKAPAPKAKVPAPKAKVPAPKAKVPAPKAKAPAPKAKTPAPKAKAPAPKAKAPAPKAKAPAPKAKAPAPKAKVSAKKPPLPAVEETSHALDFAFSFAEMMKRENRRKDEEAQAAQQAVRLTRRPTTRAKGKETLKFPAEDLAEFKKRLLQLRQSATGQSKNLRSVALEQSDERSSEDEDGSDAFLRLQSLSQVDAQNKVVRKIDEALVRIAEGTYGICEMCGQLIRKPRLMNMPFVHTCMECQSAMESPYGLRG